MELRTFKYVGVNAEGKPVHGKMEALNRAVCLKYLQSKSFEISRLAETKNFLAKLNQITVGRYLNTNQLIFFLKQLGSLLKARVNILSALELLSFQQPNRGLRMLYFELYQHVYNGLSFSKALSMRPKEFPPFLTLMIEVGEISGELPETVIAMAAHFEKQTKIQSQLKGAVRMPLVYLAATVVIAAGMMMFVFPSITDLFSSFEGTEMPGITVFFLAMGDFMVAYAGYLFGGLAFLILLLGILNKKVPSFHRGWTLFLMRFPIFGKLIQMESQILIANSLAQMMESGINSVKALRTVKTVLSNVIYKELIAKTLGFVDDGLPFSKAFEESEFIDPIMARMIATGEQTGDIPNLMKNLATYYNGITELRVEQIKNAIQPLLLIIVYALVGVMILALMLPMLSLGSQI